jgi:hypothetical protein
MLEGQGALATRHLNSEESVNGSTSVWRLQFIIDSLEIRVVGLTGPRNMCFWAAPDALFELLNADVCSLDRADLFGQLIADKRKFPNDDSAPTNLND